MILFLLFSVVAGQFDYYESIDYVFPFENFVLYDADEDVSTHFIAERYFGDKCDENQESVSTKSSTKFIKRPKIYHRK